MRVMEGSKTELLSALRTLNLDVVLSTCPRSTIVRRPS
jgi:hypothetical protein